MSDREAPSTRRRWRRWPSAVSISPASTPKPWTDEVVRAADVIITVGCGHACPIFPGIRYENWDLDDPAGQEVAQVRSIRDEIERRVPQLLTEIDVPAA